jgi:hypothetical protein
MTQVGLWASVRSCVVVQPRAIPSTTYWTTFHTSRKLWGAHLHAAHLIEMLNQPPESAERRTKSLSLMYINHNCHPQVHQRVPAYYKHSSTTSFRRPESQDQYEAWGLIPYRRDIDVEYYLVQDECGLYQHSYVSESGPESIWNGFVAAQIGKWTTMSRIRRQQKIVRKSE